MTVTLTKNVVKNIATAFRRIIPRRVTVPVLEHLLFATGTDGCLHVAGTNLEETLTLKLSGVLPDATNGDASFLFPFQQITSLAKSLSRSATVELSPDDDQIRCSVTVDGQTTSDAVDVPPADEFPVNDWKPAQNATGALDGFLDAYRRVATFASTDETRHVLNGVFWDSEDVVLVATDGRRIGTAAPREFNLPESLIIPRTKFLEKHRITGEESVDFRVLERHGDAFDFAIAGNSFEYRVQCVEGTYPNYRQVIPDVKMGFAGAIRIHPDDITMVKEAVSRLGADGPDHALIIYGRPDAVAVMSPKVLSEELGNGGQHVLLVNSTFERELAGEAAGCVNARFLLDFLNNGFTTLHMNDGFNAWLIEGNGTGAVMPLRIDSAAPIHAYAAKHLHATAQDAVAGPVEEAENKEDTRTMDNNTENATAGTETEPAKTEHKPDLTVVEKADPMETFMGLVTEAQQKLKEATTAVRDLRKAGKALERDFKDREKQLATREKEFEKSAKLITRLQEAIAA